MRKINRVALIALSSVVAAALFAVAQAAASDVVERVIQPPAMRAAKPVTETLVLPSASSAAGTPPTHTLILPLVRQPDATQRQVTAPKLPADKLILPLVRSASGERATHKLVLPQVTQQGATRQITASGLRLTQTLILPMVMAAGAIQQAATQLKAVVACAESIQNGGFEATALGRPWVGVANLSYNRNGEAFISTVRAHTDKQSAHIGSPKLGNYWSELIQTVELPKRTTSVTLTYWRYLDIPAINGTRSADTFTAGIETEQGIQIVAPQLINAATAGRGVWVKSTLTLPNPASYAGRRMWVTFKGRTGARYPATLYIDDVQLSVCAMR